MRKMIERKINEIQGHPEHIRHRTVLILTIIVSAIILLLWAFLLLPAQLTFS